MAPGRQLSGLILACLAMLILEQAEGARPPLSLINHWYKVACLPSQLRLSDNYICDRFGRILCLPGWTDESTYCSIPVCDPPCVKHQGNCTGPNTCTCEVGWRGQDCNQCVDLPGCQYGRCDKPFECNCEEGYFGMFCDKPICSETCVHGTCTAPGGCNCHPGWTGENCDECIKLPDCQHGFCEKPLECQCEEGYEGNYCEKAICRDGCNSTYGACHVPDTCICTPGIQGVNCDECIPHPGCRNGFCRDQPFECICEDGWEGYLCEIRIEDDNNAAQDVRFPSLNDHQLLQQQQLAAAAAAAAAAAQQAQQQNVQINPNVANNFRPQGQFTFGAGNGGSG